MIHFFFSTNIKKQATNYVYHWKPTGDYSKIEMRTAVKKTFVNKTNKIFLINCYSELERFEKVKSLMFPHRCLNKQDCSVVVPNENPLFSPNMKKKPWVKGWGSEEGLRNKLGNLEEDQPPEQSGSSA